MLIGLLPLFQHLVKCLITRTVFRDYTNKYITINGFGAFKPKDLDFKNFETKSHL